MSRQEFPKSVRVAALKRAMDERGVIRCEECHCEAKTPEIDHINADGLTGKPTLDNARVLCRACHKIKTADDVAKIAKAKRVEQKHLGAKPQPSKPIQSAGFPPVDKSLKKNRQPLTKFENLGPSGLARRFQLRSSST